MSAAVASEVSLLADFVPEVRAQTALCADTLGPARRRMDTLLSVVEGNLGDLKTALLEKGDEALAAGPGYPEYSADTALFDVGRLLNWCNRTLVLIPEPAGERDDEQRTNRENLSSMLVH